MNEMVARRRYVAANALEALGLIDPSPTASIALDEVELFFPPVITIEYLASHAAANPVDNYVFGAWVPVAAYVTANTQPFLNLGAETSGREFWTPEAPVLVLIAGKGTRQVRKEADPEGALTELVSGIHIVPFTNQQPENYLDRDFGALMGRLGATRYLSQAALHPAVSTAFLRWS